MYTFDLKGNLVHCIPYKAPQPEATKTPVQAEEEVLDQD